MLRLSTCCFRKTDSISGLLNDPWTDDLETILTGFKPKKNLPSPKKNLQRQKRKRPSYWWPSGPVGKSKGKQGYLVRNVVFADVTSELLADQYFCPSGVLEFGELDKFRLPTSSELRALGFSAAVVASYTTHVRLRKRANKICGSLYDPQAERIVKTFEEQLEDESWEHPELFNSDDPTNQILLARIQQKLWDAEVTNYCPWLKEALDLSRNACPDWSCETCPIISLEIVDNTKQCINAILNSTKAFHTTWEKRSIITNIVGTAHVYVLDLIDR